MPEDPQVLQELKAISQIMSSLNVNLANNTRALTLFVDHQKKKDEVYESVIAREFTIAHNDFKLFDPVNNPGFNRARVFLDAGFTPAHSGGLSVVMIYKNSPINEVLKVLSSNGSAGKFSDPIDIAELSGFQFEVINQDKSQETTVKNFRIVLYNEARA